MKWYNSNGLASHTHEFESLKSGNNTVLQPDRSANIVGNMNVGTNGHVAWQMVPTIIQINRGKTISISVDDQKTNHHFAAQRILGIVTSLTPCSETPGPNMEILTSCNMQSTVSATPNMQKSKVTDAPTFIMGQLIP